MPKLWAAVPTLQNFPSPHCPHCDESASLSVERDTPPPLLRSSAARPAKGRRHDCVQRHTLPDVATSRQSSCDRFYRPVNPYWNRAPRS